MAWNYPHVDIDVRTVKAATTVSTQPSPLHSMVTFLFTEKGPELKPVGGDGGTLPLIFGSGTFDNTKPYYNHQTMLAMRAMNANRVFVIRVVDDAAKAASLVLELTLTKGPITQYQRDANGAYILDPTTNLPQPVTQTGGTAVTEDGFTAKWDVRELAEGEEYDALTPKVTGSADNPTSYTYPIIAIQAKYRSAAGNRYGFRFWKPTSEDATTEARINARLYRFQPVELADDVSGNISLIADSTTATYNDVTLNQRNVDPNTAQNVSLPGILANNYPKYGTQGALDFDTNVYSENVEAIGALLNKVAPSEFPSSLSPYLINIVSATDMSGNPYAHLLMDASTVSLLNSSNALFMLGGSDGDTSVENYESLVAAYVSGQDNVEFQNQFRYPFTHFYDSGFSLNNKFALLNMLALRKGMYLQMTTFDASAKKPNTQAQDQSTLAALNARMTTYTESSKFGTPTMRGSIDLQAGKLAVSTGYTDGWVSPVVDVLSKNILYYSDTYVKGTPKGRPNNEVTLFSEISWDSATPQLKEANWEGGGNTISYADENTLFYPDRRTVYTDDTALLSSETFATYVCFVEKIGRAAWTNYVGREEPIEELKDDIARDIDKEIARVFGSRLQSKTTVKLTELDTVNGFSCTVVIQLIGYMPNRIWTIEIPVSRDIDVVTASS